MSPRLYVLPLFFAACGFAAVTRVEIADRADVLGGATFGIAGAYERIAGKIYFAVDPKLAPNRFIADIDLAPRNAQGKVEFSADLYILKPRDPAKGNGTALVEISNRGGKSLLNTFDLASPSLDPRSPLEFGDNFLLNRGFTLVWIGWEFDIPPAPGLLRLYAPIATNNGQPIEGLVRSEWEGDRRVTTIPLGDRNLPGYPVADASDPANKIFVRDTLLGERRLIARDKWTFADATHVQMDSGFEPGKIYEVIYKAKNPVLAGLGPAAVRDMVSFLKFGGVETALDEQHTYLKRAFGFGISQSGRFLRTFVYDGFNEDENSRQVFDGVWAHVAGAGRGAFNARFAQPSRDGHPFFNVFYPVDLPPFTDDGLLQKAADAHVVPKIFYTNGSYEYWGRAASLIHTSPEGKHDAASRGEHPYLLLRRLAAYRRLHSAAKSGSPESVRYQRLPHGDACPVGRDAILGKRRQAAACFQIPANCKGSARVVGCVCIPQDREYRNSHRQARALSTRLLRGASESR